MSEEYVVFVAPDGCDTNAGTEESPLGTIQAAVLRARGMDSTAKRIVIRGGSYYDVNLLLTQEESGLTIEAYDGEYPVLYGGIPVHLWSKEGEFYSAPVKGVKEHLRDFRAIEVNNEFRQRARLPERGAFKHLNEFHVRWMSTTAGGWERKPTEEELMTLKYREEDMGSWLDVNNAELTIFHEWDESLVGVDHLDAEKRLMYFSNPPGHPPGAFAERNKNAQTYVIWNTIEGMKQPGQWYLDRTREKLVYWPLSGEDIEKTHIVAPSREHVLQIQADNISIKGLTFACTTTPLMAGGYAAAHISGAIIAKSVENILFENVTVRNTGGWAFRVEGDSIRFKGCHIHHTGAGGIQYHGRDCEVTHTVIHDIGLVYPSAVALMGGGEKNRITRNEIYNTPYCGINNVGNHSVVKGNLIHNIKTFMQDGGAIYCFGGQNVVISENVVLSDHRKGIAVNAYYLDETSENCLVENNLAVNTYVPVLSHMTRKCSYINNIFIDKGDIKIHCANTSDLAFERNILVGGKIIFQAPRGNRKGLMPEPAMSDVMKPYSDATGITSMKNNIIYSRSEQILFEELFHYWAFDKYPLNPEEGTLFINPLFREPEQGDFTFQEDTVPQKLGIQPLNFEEAGCTGSFYRVIRDYYSL